MGIWAGFEMMVGGEAYRDLQFFSLEMRERFRSFLDELAPGATACHHFLRAHAQECFPIW